MLLWRGWISLHFLGGGFLVGGVLVLGWVINLAEVVVGAGV